MRAFKTYIQYLVFLCAFSTAYSQQMPQYSQWASHQFALNPAHAGIKQCIDLQTLYRAQWVGFEGAPKSGFVTASVPLRSKRNKYLSARHGMGVKFEHDRIGQMGLNRFNLAYAGHFNFSKDTRLSLGMYGGLMQFGFDPTTATTISADQAVLRDASSVSPDAHFGAWWNGLNYYTGLTLNQLIPSRWPMGTESNQSLHMMMNAGYRFTLNEKYTLLPGILVKVPFVGPIVYDLNLNLDIKNMFNLGVGFRNQDALIFMAGFKIKQQFSIQYSYDVTISPLQKVSSNTHEISIGFITCKPERKGFANCSLFE